MDIQKGMPRILQIINQLGHGGAEIMLLDFFKFADHKEFDYHLLLPYGESEMDIRARQLGVSLHFPDSSNLMKSKRVLLSDCVDKIREIKPDLIHTHTRFSDLVGLYGGKLAGVPARMMTIHQEGWYFLGSMPLLEGVIETFFIAPKATHYAVISKAVERYARKYGFIPADKITVIHNGIDPDRVCPAARENREQVRSRLGIGLNDFMIIAMGRFLYEKGFDIILNEFKTFLEKSGEGKLCLAGYGKKDEELKALSLDLGISSNVVFHGKYDNPADLLRASDCFVHSSRIEGFGIVVLEAMANAVPVIASAIGGLPEIITDGVDGFLHNHKQRGMLADLMINVFKNPEMAKKVALEGQKTATGKFHINNTARNYENLYRKILADTA